jgi:hypothetical protein
MRAADVTSTPQLTIENAVDVNPLHSPCSEAWRAAITLRACRDSEHSALPESAQHWHIARKAQILYGVVGMPVAWSRIPFCPGPDLAAVLKREAPRG